MMPTLRVVAGRDVLKFAYIADDEQVIIGRADTAELRLTDATVSYRHARVLSNGNGQITVIDLHSTNGTRVNGQSIRARCFAPATTSRSAPLRSVSTCSRPTSSAAPAAP